jgi:RNA polymerase sigma-70 factor (ECF subfamily)
MLRNLADRLRSSAAPRRASAASDAALIERVARGELHAFETLYRGFHARLRRFLGLMTPDRALVDEVLNDTMLVVWRRAASYNGTCAVSTWIFAIAYRTALKALSRRDEPHEDPVDEILAPELGPEEQRSVSEARAALLHALDGLSAEQRAVLVLTYFHDLSCGEIAEIVGCPVDTVKTRAFHGRRRLRALLSGELGDWW